MMLVQQAGPAVQMHHLAEQPLAQDGAAQGAEDTNTALKANLY